MMLTLTALGDAMREVNATIEEMRRENHPLALPSALRASCRRLGQASSVPPHSTAPKCHLPSRRRVERLHPGWANEFFADTLHRLTA